MGRADVVLGNDIPEDLGCILGYILVVDNPVEDILHRSCCAPIESGPITAQKQTDSSHAPLLRVLRPLVVVALIGHGAMQEYDKERERRFKLDGRD